MPREDMEWPKRPRLDPITEAACAPSLALVFCCALPPPSLESWRAATRTLLRGSLAIREDLAGIEYALGIKLLFDSTHQRERGGIDGAVDVLALG